MRNDAQLFCDRATYEIIDVTRKRDLELGGLIDDLKPERDLVVPFGKGGKGNTYPLYRVAQNGQKRDLTSKREMLFY